MAGYDINYIYITKLCFCQVEAVVMKGVWKQGWQGSRVSGG